MIGLARYVESGKKILSHTRDKARRLVDNREKENLPCRIIGQILLFLYLFLKLIVVLRSLLFFHIATRFHHVYYIIS